MSKQESESTLKTDYSGEDSKTHESETNFDTGDDIEMAYELGTDVAKSIDQEEKRTKLCSLQNTYLFNDAYILISVVVICIVFGVVLRQFAK